MLRILWSFIFGEAQRCVRSGMKEIHVPDCAHLVREAEIDIEEIAKRVSVQVLAGFKKELAKVKKPASKAR